MITNVEYLNGYRLLCTFDDGQKRLIDLEKFFINCPLPQVQRFVPLDKFKTVRVDYGTVAWGDNECDINPMDIYEGMFEAEDSPYKEDIKATLAAREAWKKEERRKAAAKRKASIRRKAKQAQAGLSSKRSTTKKAVQ